MTYGVRRGLPYAQFLHIEVGKLKEYGLLQNYLRRDAPKSPNCFGQHTEEAIKVRKSKSIEEEKKSEADNASKTDNEPEKKKDKNQFACSEVSLSHEVGLD